MAAGSFFVSKARSFHANDVKFPTYVNVVEVEAPVVEGPHAGQGSVTLQRTEIKIRHQHRFLVGL